MSGESYGIDYEVLKKDITDLGVIYQELEKVDCRFETSEISKGNFTSEIESITSKIANLKLEAINLVNTTWLFLDNLLGEVSGKDEFTASDIAGGGGGGGF